MCTLRPPDCANNFGQWGHFQSLIIWWTDFSCLFKFTFCEKAVSHSSHTWSLILSWTLFVFCQVTFLSKGRPTFFTYMTFDFVMNPSYVNFKMVTFIWLIWTLITSKLLSHYDVPHRPWITRHQIKACQHYLTTTELKFSCHNKQEGLPRHRNVYGWLALLGSKSIVPDSELSTHSLLVRPSLNNQDIFLKRSLPEQNIFLLVYLPVAF